MTGLKDDLRHYAQQLGFSMMAVAPARPSPYLDAYLTWIKAGMHGTMDYMARPDRIERREDLNVILQDAKSLIIVGLDYVGLANDGSYVSKPNRGRIASYAWGQDYHDVMLAKLEELTRFLKSRVGESIAFRAYVDTGAILERSHAAGAGIGFVGKNTMLIHPRRGSYFFLGEIVTTIDLAPDNPPDMPGCGTCTRCLSACPTEAFPSPYVLDARKCISYLTIEHTGWIDRDLRPLMGNWIFGCDVCQEVCPWQRFADTDTRANIGLSDGSNSPELSSVLRLDDSSFMNNYEGTPIERIGRDRLVRNACVAAGNSQSQELNDNLIDLLSDRSPVVRGHAAWALAELGAAREPLQTRFAIEQEPQVRLELQLALSKL